jgi:hypothetical protein
MLTKEQIDHLFDFCEAQGVKYYDVQVELVDHLANAIEKELAEHPDWPFQKALDVVFVSFGHENFKPLVREKQKAIQAYSLRLWWALFREQLRWPAMWAVFGLFLFGYRLLSMRYQDLSFNICITSGIFILFVIYFENYRLKRLEKRKGKSFLVTNLTGLPALLAYLNIAIGYAKLRIPGHVTGLHILLAGTVNFAYFLVCVAYYRTVKQQERQVKHDYPEIFKLT